MPMGRVTFTVDRSLDPMIDERMASVQLGLMQRVTAIDFQLQAIIAGEKLQGEVLNSHTGDLARSVRALPTTIDDDVISGGVAAGGGAVNYARVHEFGVDHPWTVEAKNVQALAFLMAGRMVFAKKVTIPGMPERSFLRSTLVEKQDWIIAQLRAAVAEALEQ